MHGLAGSSPASCSSSRCSWRDAARTRRRPRADRGGAAAGGRARLDRAASAERVTLVFRVHRFAVTETAGRRTSRSRTGPTIRGASAGRRRRPDLVRRDAVPRQTTSTRWSTGAPDGDLPGLRAAQHLRRRRSRRGSRPARAGAGRSPRPARSRPGSTSASCSAPSSRSAIRRREWSAASRGSPTTRTG